jgi:hypothetical protein
METLNKPERFAYVEFDGGGRPVTIFRTLEQATQSVSWDCGLVKAWSRRRAVGAIRRQVFDRDGWCCVHCGVNVTWQTGEMHERQPRGDIRKMDTGYQGGFISLENSETRCRDCHTGPEGAHASRAPRFGELPI